MNDMLIIFVPGFYGVILIISNYNLLCQTVFCIAVAACYVKILTQLF